MLYYKDEDLSVSANSRYGSSYIRKSGTPVVYEIDDWGADFIDPVFGDIKEKLSCKEHGASFKIDLLTLLQLKTKLSKDVSVGDWIKEKVWE